MLLLTVRLAWIPDWHGGTGVMLDFIKLGRSIGKKLLPAVHRLIGVPLNDRPRLPECLLVKRRVAAEIVELQMRL